MSSSLQLPDDDAETCAFCAYLDDRRPYAIAKRYRLTAVLVTQEPRGCPHALVTTLSHRPTLLETTDSEAAELLVVARDVARVIDRLWHRPGIAVWQNNGQPAHQAIGHVHLHVAGTLDGQATEWGPVRERPLEWALSVAARLGQGLDTDLPTATK